MACGGCDSKGYLWVWPKYGEESDKINPVVFRCDCSIGRAKFSTGIPLWRDELARKFNLKAPEIKEPVPEAQEQAVEPVQVKVKPQGLTESEKAFLRALKASKEWGHPRLKDLIGIYGTEAVKAAIMGRN